MTKKVHVKIPATSANMGSGFDAVGIALTLYNEILFEERPGAEAITIEIKGMGQNEIPTDPREIWYRKPWNTWQSAMASRFLQVI